MNEVIKKVLNKIESYKINQIQITEYCREKMNQRNVSEELLTSTLFSNELNYVEKQKRLFGGKEEIRYKLIFKISSRYSLIIVVLFGQNILKVLNVIKTSKEIERWRKKMLK